MSNLTLEVNGKPVTGDAAPHTLLVDFLRASGLTGTHVGCETSQCGACTLLVDGDAVKSCSMLAVQAQGCEVTTIEGLAPEGSLHPIQQAFVDCHGLQCGYCTPGFVMATACLLAKQPSPSEAEIVEGLEGNICRCTGYVNIVKSVQQAAGALSGAATTKEASHG